MNALALNERDSRVDWPLWLALLLLLGIGVVFIYSAIIVNESAATLPWYRQRHLLQVLWGLLGIGGAVALCVIDYRSLSRWSWLAYWATILLLVAVLIPGIGSVRYGARRWIDLGLLQFQPSEFAKLTFILAMGHFLSRPGEELRQPRLFFKALGMIALPFALILREPDLGSALVLLPVGLGMMYVAGVPARYLRRFVAALAVLVGLLVVDVLFASERWQVIRLEPYQQRRLQVYFGTDFAPPGATAVERRQARIDQRNYSYNVEQALISVGSGGLTGKGWRLGTQNALGFLPRGVAHNDFIFSVIAEESGFVGSLLVLLLYTVVCFTGLRGAGQARDRLGKILAVGVVALFFSHVFINIGMNIRLMPVTGIPLPLLSYGGSSVLTTLLAAGLLQNVWYYRKSY
jgi:rod shape determining protein RodA